MTHTTLPKRRNHNTPHPFTIKKQGRHTDTTARSLFFYLVSRNRPEPKKTQTDYSASVLVSVFSPISCQLTRKTGKKLQLELKDIIRMCILWFRLFSLSVHECCGCVCVSICGCKVGWNVQESVSVCGQRVVRHGVSEVTLSFQRLAT